LILPHHHQEEDMKKILGFTIPLAVVCLALGGLYYLVDVSRASATVFLSTSQGSILVTTLEDELNGDGDCSLREAIEAANDNLTVDACAAGDAVYTDTITFDVAGTITVTSQLSVTDGGPLVIDGGDVITTSGGGTTRVWWIGSGSDLTLKQIAIIKGESDEGGGLYNDSGDVTIEQSTFYTNQASVAGGIFNLGTLKITESNFIDNNGYAVTGAIRSFGTMTVENTIFVGNSSYGAGGGIDDWGSLFVTNSTFIDNVGGGIGSGGTLVVDHSLFTGNTGSGIGVAGNATIKNSTFKNNLGSGIYSGIIGLGNITIDSCTISGNTANQGGGIYINGPTVVRNSTISGNSAGNYGGGIFIYNSLDEFTFSIENSTINDNNAPIGGGVAGGGTPGYGSGTLYNTIIADNPSGGDCYDGYEEMLTDGGHNLDSDGSCGLEPANGSLPNTDPLLGPLQDNGGPTYTEALLVGSPAIDAGVNAQCPETDQRGYHRPADGNGDGVFVCDIGAFEFIRVILLLHMPTIFRAP
jgi:CSLREA domain-containing protein